MALVRYWLFLLLVFLVQHLPLRLCYGLASLGGDLAYVFWGKGRENTLANMRCVLGPQADEAKVRATAHRSLRNYVKILVDFLRLPRLSDKSLERMVRVNGWEHLDRAVESGEGVLLVGTHLGNWDLAGALVAARGYSLAAVAEKLANPFIDRWAWRSREVRGIQLMSMDEAPLKIYRALGRNKVVAVVTDRPLYEDGVPIVFFGAETRWPKGVGALALRTGAQVLTGYLVRDRHDDFTGEVVPVEFQSASDRELDIQRLTQKVADVQEGFIRRYPDQWYMFRRMWPRD